MSRYYNENSFWYFTDRDYAQVRSRALLPIPGQPAGHIFPRASGTSSTRSRTSAPTSSPSRTGRGREDSSTSDPRRAKSGQSASKKKSWTSRVACGPVLGELCE